MSNQFGNFNLPEKLELDIEGTEPPASAEGAVPLVASPTEPSAISPPPAQPAVPTEPPIENSNADTSLPLPPETVEAAPPPNQPIEPAEHSQRHHRTISTWKLFCRHRGAGVFDRLPACEDRVVD